MKLLSAHFKNLIIILLVIFVKVSLVAKGPSEGFYFQNSESIPAYGFVGERVEHADIVVTKGTLFADGSTISRTVYSDLFAVVGTTYGSGDGSTLFSLPDWRGRMALGVDKSENAEKIERLTLYPFEQERDLGELNELKGKVGSLGRKKYHNILNMLIKKIDTLEKKDNQ